MARLSVLFALFGLLSSTLATANSEIQRRKLDCIVSTNHSLHLAIRAATDLIHRIPASTTSPAGLA